MVENGVITAVNKELLAIPLESLLLRKLGSLLKSWRVFIKAAHLIQVGGISNLMVESY